MNENKYDFSDYILAFDEIHALTSTSYREAMSDEDKDLTGRIQQIVNDVLSILIKAYKKGVEVTAQMLAYDISVNVDSMYKAIYEVIDGKTFEGRIAEHVLANDLDGLQVLVESEYHRVFTQGEEDGAYQFQNERGFGVSKTWATMRDEKVRETHKYLEGMAVSLDEEFYTFDGDHAPIPGHFQKAENNVGCRCVVYLKIDTSQD